MAIRLNETVELRPHSCDFNVEAGNSVYMIWTFPADVTVADWTQVITFAGGTVSFGLTQVTDRKIGATLTRTNAAIVGTNSSRWRLRRRPVAGEEQESYKGRWTPT